MTASLAFPVLEYFTERERVLRERIAVLEEEVRQLRANIGVDEPPVWRWRHFGLGAVASRLFEVMMRRDVASKDALMLCVREEAGPKCLHVHICKMRRKLAPFGIEILTVHANGYSIPAASKRLAGETAEALDTEARQRAELAIDAAAAAVGAARALVADVASPALAPEAPV